MSCRVIGTTKLAHWRGGRPPIIGMAGRRGSPKIYKNQVRTPAHGEVNGGFVHPRGWGRVQ